MLPACTACVRASRSRHIVRSMLLLSSSSRTLQHCGRRGRLLRSSRRFYRVEVDIVPLIVHIIQPQVCGQCIAPSSRQRNGHAMRWRRGGLRCGLRRRCVHCLRALLRGGHLVVPLCSVLLRPAMHSSMHTAASGRSREMALLRLLFAVLRILLCRCQRLSRRLLLSDICVVDCLLLLQRCGRGAVRRRRRDTGIPQLRRLLQLNVAVHLWRLKARTCLLSWCHCLRLSQALCCDKQSVGHQAPTR